MINFNMSLYGVVYSQMNQADEEMIKYDITRTDTSLAVLENETTCYLAPDSNIHLYNKHMDNPMPMKNVQGFIFVLDGE